MFGDCRVGVIDCVKTMVTKGKVGNLEVQYRQAGLDGLMQEGRMKDRKKRRKTLQQNKSGRETCSSLYLRCSVASDSYPRRLAGF